MGKFSNVFKALRKESTRNKVSTTKVDTIEKGTEKKKDMSYISTKESVKDEATATRKMRALVDCLNKPVEIDTGVRDDSLVYLDELGDIEIFIRKKLIKDSVLTDLVNKTTEAFSSDKNTEQSYDLSITPFSDEEFCYYKDKLKGYMQEYKQKGLCTTGSYNYSLSYIMQYHLFTLSSPFKSGDSVVMTDKLRKKDVDVYTKLVLLFYSHLKLQRIDLVGEKAGVCNWYFTTGNQESINTEVIFFSVYAIKKIAYQSYVSPVVFSYFSTQLSRALDCVLP